MNFKQRAILGDTAWSRKSLRTIMVCQCSLFGFSALEFTAAVYLLLGAPRISISILNETLTLAAVRILIFFSLPDLADG